MNEEFYCADCHCDSILDVCDYGKSIITPYNVSQEHKSLQLFAMWVEAYEIDPNEYWNMLMARIDAYDNEIDRHPDWMKCYSYEDMKKARAEGKNIAILSIEGSACINSVERLHIAYEKGIRVMTLTWNMSNCLAAGSDSTGTENDYGLTDLGREIVTEAGKLGIMIDLSHASDNTARDILALNDRPVMASHSNYRSVCPHNRNLPDDIADEIVRRGGHIGLNLFRWFIEDHMEAEDYTAEKLFKHVDYALSRGYGKNIGWGGDIDGIDAYPKDFSMEKSMHDQYLELMKKHGYDNELIKDIFYRNFFNLMERFGL